MDKYIKRIQTRVRRQGRKVTKQDCRDVYQQVVNTLESPTDTEINTVVETLLQENHPISSPETLDITPETHPDIWQTLSPPNPESARISYLGGDKAEDRGQKAEGKEEGNNNCVGELGITSQEEHQPIQQLSQPGNIAQSDIQNLVSQTFANQPQEVKDQITTFAAQHSFENIRQVQDFLDQLRSMEFSLLVKTLQDHFSRRGMMLNTLNDLLLNQQEKDQQERERFFHQSQNLLMTFQQEIETRLSRDGL
ncbi:hypothetical protein [Coleofasciculus sp. E1-EBD-02]|uniref:hypothetical protein n=1 Tax=Coleofasciculus sp. E1-EBD-02 TaxID=3068481 RepID=UPI0032F70932